MIQVTEFEEFIENVYNAMTETLSNTKLGLRPLGYKQGYWENYTKTVITCLSNTASMWYGTSPYIKAGLYAVAINSVDEYLGANVLIDDDPEFWKSLYMKAVNEQIIIQEKIKNIKPGDIVNIDDYHNETMERLNANTQ